MKDSFFAIFRAHRWSVLTLGLAYGATVVFTFFGPVMARAASTYAPALSLVAVACHVLAFYLPVVGVEPRDRYITLLSLLLVPGVSAFGVMPIWGKTLITILYAWTIGRIGCFWTYRTARVIPGHVRGRIVAGALFTAFVLLYFVNMAAPSLTPDQALAVPAALSLATLVSYLRMKAALDPSAPPAPRLEPREPSYFSFLLLVYIAGGFTYAGIYPYFEPWSQVDRYVNVNAFLLTAPLAGWLLDRGKVPGVFCAGVVCLGLSFGFFLSPPSLAGYLGTQGFLQMGWACINVFGWYFCWATAARTGQPYHFPRGIAAMLLGAALGAFGASLLQAAGEVEKWVYGLISFIPMALALAWLIFRPASLGLNPSPQDPPAQR